MKKNLLATTALSAALLLAPALAFAVGTNGSFELGTDPGVFATLNPGDTNITDWSVDSGSVDYIGTYWPASSGTRSVDLNGLAPGSISQTIPTVIGATYDVSFDLSGNPDSRPAEDPLFSPSLKQVAVSATGAAPQTFSYNTATAGNSLANMMWAPHTYSFVATSASTVLTFASSIAGAFGPAVDNIAIAETLPPQCDATATQTIVSDTVTFDQTDAHAAVAVTPHPAWTTISGATWVYSDPLDVNGSSPTGTKVFTRTFTIVGTPQDSSLEIATDNMYSVMVNGNPLTTGTSATDLNNFSTSDTWTIPASMLVSGANTITFTVTNPALNPADNTPFGDPNPGGLLYKLTINSDDCVTPPTHVHVTIAKYVGGVHATALNANNESFTQQATYTFTNEAFPSGVSGSNAYDIGPVGNNTPTAYEAKTLEFFPGASYSTVETVPSSNVGADCSSGKPYALAGYSVGANEAAAQLASVSMTTPSFTNLQSNQFVIVWNTKCPTTGTVSGYKFYDVNGNGVWNAGEPGLSGWTFNLTVGPTSGSQVTGAGGAYTFSGVLAGAYTVTETLQAGWTKTTANPSFTLAPGENKTDVNIGNSCFVGTGGKGKGYWTNKNGQALINDGNSSVSELALLSGLNLRNANGTDFNPTSYTQYSTWNTNATAVNMAYMLSAQLSALVLSEEAGLINGSKQIYVPGLIPYPASGVSPLGVITIDALIAAANAELLAHGNTTTPNAFRAYQEALKNAVESAAEGNIQLCQAI